MPRTWTIACTLLILVAAGGCARTLPRTRVFAPIHGNDSRLVFVTANRERENLLDQLETAGFTVVSRPSEATAVVEARIGSAQLPRSCGGFRNVAFIVSQDSVRSAVIKGRGWTGTCDKNMLLSMSHELARLFYQSR